tara:strand:- start:1498 stop:1806 length:309 start_codon:yes stop_codon:yes gene_type:complete
MNTFLLLTSLVINSPNAPMGFNSIDLQCSLKGAIFGHSWQKHQEGTSKTKIIEDLVIKLNQDGAPTHYVSVWVEQMDAALNIPDYYLMVGEIVYQCLINKGV